MGVGCIVMWDLPEGMNPIQGMEMLQKKAELLGGRSLGPWSIECETLQSTPALSAGGPQKLIHMLHSSEYPRTTFAVLDSMTCIVADNSLDTIFSNLRQYYAPSSKKAQKIDVKGYSFSVQKYTLKFGSIAIGSTNRGIIVETESAKEDVVSKCWDELAEFVKGLLDFSNPLNPHTSAQPYKPSDSMIHYAMIFTQLRKPAMPSTTPTK